MLSAVNDLSNDSLKLVWYRCSSNLYVLLRSESSWLVSKSLVQTWNDSNHGAVPKRGRRSILPARTGWIQNRLVPVEPFLNATNWIWLRRGPDYAILQFRGDDVLWVPELARASVCNSCECAATWRPPVRCEDRLPYDEHSHSSIGMPRQQLLSCGGPPQTSWSSRRQEQHQPRNGSLSIERLLKLPEICLGKSKNRLLASWRRAGTPQVCSHQQYKNCRYCKADEPFRFHLP